VDRWLMVKLTPGIACLFSSLINGGSGKGR
jgi:hypothetical protein